MSKKHSRLSHFLVLATVIPQSLWAGSLTAPYDLSSAQVLPEGVFNPRFKFISTSLEQKFGAAGDVLPLANEINRPITWQDVLKNEPDPVKRAQVQSLIQDAGGNILSGQAGSTTGVVNTYTEVYVPALSYGLSSRVSLGLGVPIYKMDIKADTGFVKTLEGQAVIYQAAQSGSPVSAEEAKNKLNNAMRDKLAGLGYNPIESKSFSSIGDLKLGAKVLAYQDRLQSLAVSPALTLPTGKEANVDDLIPSSTGDGQTDLGVTVSYDRKLIAGLSAGVYGGIVSQLPDEVEKRIPTLSDSLSSDKEVVSRNLGDQYSSGAGLQYRFSKIGVTLGAGYHLQYQNRTTYSGNLFSAERYGLMGESSQTLHSVTATAGFSTVEFFQRKTFFYPFETQISYNRGLSGRNTYKGDVFQAEMVLFF